MDVNLGVLNFVTISKAKARRFLDWQVLLCFSGWGPKKLAESEGFLISQDDVGQKVLKPVVVNLWVATPLGSNMRYLQLEQQQNYSSETARK